MEPQIKIAVAAVALWELSCFLRHRNANDVSKKIENCPKCGGLSEWFMELVLKTSDGVKPTVSSNLTASANQKATRRGGFFALEDLL